MERKAERTNGMILRFVEFDSSALQTALLCRLNRENSPTKQREKISDSCWDFFGHWKPEASCVEARPRVVDQNWEVFANQWISFQWLSSSHAIHVSLATVWT